MGKHDLKAKKLHLSHIGDENLAMCGWKFKVQSDGTYAGTGFTNPNAVLCDRCENLMAANGFTVRITWTGTHWTVKATPPDLELVERAGRPAIVDRNDPRAAPVYLTQDKLDAVLGQTRLAMLWATYGPQEVKAAVPTDVS